MKNLTKPIYFSSTSMVSLLFSVYYLRKKTTILGQTDKFRYGYQSLKRKLITETV